MPMTATTTSSSIKVNPARPGCDVSARAIERFIPRGAGRFRQKLATLRYYTEKPAKSKLLFAFESHFSLLIPANRINVLNIRMFVVSTKPNRCLWQFIVIALLAFQAAAQAPLQSFTNQANTLLQGEFGFGVTNIPVYCPTNPAIGYSASIHYLLQAAANAYDATTPATNLPSVFRPNFSWQDGNLFISGYSCVTTDFYPQTSRGFKSLTDPTISANDNVWGIPWVIGAKGRIPAFNEYCYSSAVTVIRQLQFLRFPSPTAPSQYLTTRPPQYTNQFYFMSISNAFGAEAWNFYATTFTNSVTLVLTNQVSVAITNNYDYGTNIVTTTGTNWMIQSWPGYGRSGGFMIPLFTNTVSLPYSYWSESTEQWIGPQNGVIEFLPSDANQTGWPVHNWTLSITNNLLYALIDNQTGRVLDFVNLGPFGSSLNVNQVLTNLTASPNMWVTAPAFDGPSSPLSSGALNQINEGFIQPEGLEFYDSLNGRGGYPGTIGVFEDPYVASANFVQNCSWHASDPLVHFTIDDLTDPEFNQDIILESLIDTALPISLSNPVCSLGEVNPDYNSGAMENQSFDLSDGLFGIEFTGATDLPYMIWASEDLLNWSQIGTARQPAPGVFQFEDSAITNYPDRFYQVRLP